MPTQHLWQDRPKVVPRIEPSGVPPTARPSAPERLLDDLDGVDPAVALVVQRLNPISQPNVVLVDAAVTVPNLAELARRAFEVWAVANNATWLGELDLRMDRRLALRHQRDRILYRAGTPDRLPLLAASADCVVVHVDEPLSASYLKAMLKECRRILRPCIAPPPHAPAAIGRMALSAPSPANPRSPWMQPRDGMITLQQPETLQEWLKLAAEFGFRCPDSVNGHGLIGINNEPDCVLWLELAA